VWLGRFLPKRAPKLTVATTRLTPPIKSAYNFWVGLCVGLRMSFWPKASNANETALPLEPVEAAPEMPASPMASALPVEPTAAQVGAAASKLIAARLGEITLVMSRSPATKHYALADIEWMILPPVFAGQFYIVEATHKKHGFGVPVAAFTWARVSVEVDERLSAGLNSPIRLRPDEWTSGDIHWLIHIAGEQRALEAGLLHCATNQLKGRPVRMVTRDQDGRPRVQMLHDVIAAAASDRGG
jgi:hemolysin-activating ACP:hemolysin acyltransferase